MGRTAPVFRRCFKPDGCQLLIGGHIPQPRIDLNTTIRQRHHFAGHQYFRIDHTPIGKARLFVNGLKLLYIGTLVNGFKQPRALQIGHHYHGQIRSQPLGRRVIGNVIGHSDWHWIGIALGNINAHLRKGTRHAGRAGKEDKRRKYNREKAFST